MEHSSLLLLNLVQIQGRHPSWSQENVLEVVVQIYRADSVVSWLLVAWENTDVLPSNRWAWNGPVSDSTSMCFKYQQSTLPFYIAWIWPFERVRNRFSLSRSVARRQKPVCLKEKWSIDFAEGRKLIIHWIWILWLKYKKCYLLPLRCLKHFLAFEMGSNVFWRKHREKELTRSSFEWNGFGLVCYQTLNA